MTPEEKNALLAERVNAFTPRLRTVMRRILDGDVFYTSGGSPRITSQELLALSELGFVIQGEHPLHEPLMYYRMQSHQDHNERLFAELSEAILQTLDKEKK